MNEEITIESSSNDLEGNISTKVTLEESSSDIDSFKQNQVNLRLTIALAIPTGEEKQVEQNFFGFHRRIETNIRFSS